MNAQVTRISPYDRFPGGSYPHGARKGDIATHWMWNILFQVDVLKLRHNRERNSLQLSPFVKIDFDQSSAQWTGVRREDVVWSSQLGASEDPDKSRRGWIDTVNFPQWPENSEQWSRHQGNYYFAVLGFIMLVSTLSSFKKGSGDPEAWPVATSSQWGVGPRSLHLYNEVMMEPEWSPYLLCPHRDTVFWKSLAANKTTWFTRSELV